MADFNLFWDTVLKEIRSLAKSELPKLWKEAEQDGKAFFNKGRDKLEKWAKQLDQGEISEEEFEFLVKGLKDLSEMEALKQAGLALAKIDGFKNAVIDTITKTAFKVFL
jgi:hypothetical protein